MILYSYSRDRNQNFLSTISILKGSIWSPEIGPDLRRINFAISINFSYFQIWLIMESRQSRKSGSSRPRVCRTCGQHHSHHEPHIYDYEDEVKKLQKLEIKSNFATLEKHYFKLFPYIHVILFQTFSLKVISTRKQIQFFSYFRLTKIWCVRFVYNLSCPRQTHPAPTHSVRWEIIFKNISSKQFLVSVMKYHLSTLDCKTGIYFSSCSGESSFTKQFLACHKQPFLS